MGTSINLPTIKSSVRIKCEKLPYKEVDLSESSHVFSNSDVKNKTVHNLQTSSYGTRKHRSISVSHTKTTYSYAPTFRSILFIIPSCNTDVTAFLCEEPNNQNRYSIASHRNG